MNNQADTSELESRSRGLQDAEANYWATVDEPHATEADRVEAAEMLEEAETRVRELITAPLMAAPASGSRDVQAERGVEAEL